MSDLQQTLRDLHRELSEAESLAPGDRAMLESALGDIQRALQSAPASAVATEAPGDVLEGAAVRLEAGHPGLAATVRSLIDALSKAGI
jgi:hypothetical protein